MSITDSVNPLKVQLADIKHTLTGFMNGPVSESLRNKGLSYRLIYGIELPRLMSLAAEMPHEQKLAWALWNEDIRECRLLALLLMPHEGFTTDEASLLIEQMRFAEEAQVAAMHLFVHLTEASSAAFAWMADERDMFQLCGFLLLGRLLLQHPELSPRDEAEFLDQAEVALQSANLHVRKAAQSALLRFSEAGLRQQRLSDSLFNRVLRSKKALSEELQDSSEANEK